MFQSVYTANALKASKQMLCSPYVSEFFITKPNTDIKFAKEWLQMKPEMNKKLTA